VTRIYIERENLLATEIMKEYVGTCVTIYIICNIVTQD